MPRVSGTHEGKGIQAVLLALDILEYIAQNRAPVRITELSKRFNTTKSRVYRHLQTLIFGGYIVQDEESDRYRISARLMALGEEVGQNFDITAVARPAMDRLHARLEHSVALSVPEPDGIRIVAVVRGGFNAEIGVRPGSLLPYHASAQGKVSLAFGPESLRRNVAGQPLDQLTSHTLSTSAALDAELKKVKARGWATAGNEAIVGLNALAAPVFGAFGEFAGAVAIVDSVQYVGDEPDAAQVRHLLATAGQISANLGAREAS